MATVVYNDRSDRYEVIDHGRVVSTHTTANAAKNAGRRYGKQNHQPVSYRGPNMTTATWIYSPAQDRDPGAKPAGSRGFLGSLFGP